MKFTLYQTDRLVNYTDDFSEVAEMLPFKPTAYIEAENLDEVYAKTQHGIMLNIDHDLDGLREDTGNWVGILRKGIMPAIRSTSVGDVILQGKAVYVVSNFGFDRIGTLKEIQEKYNCLQHER